MARGTAMHLMVALLLASNVLAITDIAGWDGLRGSQIQSKIVLEGGLMTNGTFSNRKWSDTSIVQHSYGLYYQIDLTQSFDARNQSTSDYMIAGLPETSNTDAPIYIAGGMFNNDYQFYTFGGLADKPPIGLSTVVRGNVFAADASITRFNQGVSPNQNTDDVSDNITSGAYASSPDQGLGFYFSGMVGATRGALEYNSDDTADNHPTITSPTFIKVDMTSANDATFENMAWPDGVTPRAEGALVWLPYGAKGVLVAIGGVEVPGDRFLFSPQDTQDGPFMTELAIYDVDADTWYTQQTLESTEQPTQLAAFCTVVVSSEDGMSHEIFVYGGYDGTYTSSDPTVRDDVWVLSVPAFQWTKVKTGDPTHGRQSNVCFSPNPTTMITIGGVGQLGSSLTSDTIIDILDLNTLEWTGKFNASTDANFVAPSAIVTQLQWPDASGPGTNAQVTGLNDTLNDLFGTKYQGEVKSYYPYSNGTSGSGKETGKKSKNSWKIPVIATLCTVIPILLIATLLFLCLRRRRKGVQRTKSSRKNVSSWLGKSQPIDPSPEKSNTSGETAVESQNAVIEGHPDYFRQHGYKNEAGQVYEAPTSVTMPGWQQYGTAAGSHERYEIMDNPRQSVSTGNQFSPQSGSNSDHVGSQRSGNVSKISERLSSSRDDGQDARHELPHPRGNENLSDPSHTARYPERLTPPLGEGTGVSMASNMTGRRPSNPVVSPHSPDRPNHRRNMSSMSSDLPSLPTPGPDEENRISRQIDILPDIPGSPPEPMTGIEENDGHRSR